MSNYTGFAKDRKTKFGSITSISFTEEHLEELKKYINDAGWVNIDVMRSKEGKPYMKINTYGLENVESQAPIATPAVEDDDVPY